MKLTARKAATAAPGRYSDGGGTGLMLYVSEGGARNWIQRVTIHGKRREIGLGGLPLVTLAEARDAAIDIKRAVAQGRDPLAEKRTARAKTLSKLTFAAAVPRVADEYRSQWRSPKTHGQFIRSLERWAVPAIGHMAIEDIDSADLRAVILAVREEATNTATKVQQRLNLMFKWAVAAGRRKDNPASADALALAKVTAQKQHFAALDPNDVAGALAQIDASGAHVHTKAILRFIALTASRSGQARGATWAEIDLDRKVWTIPAERMKSPRPHTVPLTDDAIATFPMGPREGLIFPSARGMEVSDNTLSKLHRELGIPATPHGYRTSFRVWAQRNKVSEEAAELALSHLVGSETRRAYARDDLLDQRREIMGAWADFIAGRAAPDNVIPIAKAKA